MSIDLQSTIKKATDFAERATIEDKAKNYEAAAQAYMAATEWLLHATKYGVMDRPMKHNIRAKAITYVQRAEEIKKMLDNKPKNTQAMASNENSQANSRNGKKSDDNDSPDSERKRIMQKFEANIVTDLNVTFDDVVGLEQAKTALREAVILPVKFPKLFKGKRKPWAGILLYG
ncbi:unnamed protein product, partial [Rotaria magnacalcarata]